MPDTYYVLDLETHTFDIVYGFDEARELSEKIKKEQWDKYGTVIAVPVRRVNQ